MVTLEEGRRDPFLEDYIDRQIDHYLSELREKMVDLNDHFYQVEQAQETILQGSSEQAIAQAPSPVEERSEGCSGRSR